MTADTRTTSRPDLTAVRRGAIIAYRRLVLGFTMGGIAVVILIAALLARPGAWPTSLAGVLVLQTCLVRSLLAGLADHTALYGGLHALDGLLALGIAGLLYASARRRRA